MRVSHGGGKLGRRIEAEEFGPESPDHLHPTLARTPETTYGVHAEPYLQSLARSKRERPETCSFAMTAAAAKRNEHPGVICWSDKGLNGDLDQLGS